MLRKAQNKVDENHRHKERYSKVFCATLLLTDRIFRKESFLKHSQSEEAESQGDTAKPDSETEIAWDAACISSVNPLKDPGLSFCKLIGA